MVYASSQPLSDGPGGLVKAWPPFKGLCFGPLSGIFMVKTPSLEEPMPRLNIALNDLKLQPFTALGPEGILLACGSSAERGKSNPMTVSWGMFGTVWERPVASILVRPSRHTHGLLMANPDFTLNWLPDHLITAVNICGQASGSAGDKWELAGITPECGLKSSSPVVAESILSLECRILIRQPLDPEQLQSLGLGIFYPQGDHHALLVGEVMAASATEGYKQKFG